MKFFGANKKKPIDYNQQRTAKAIVDFSLNQAKIAVNQRLSGKKQNSKKPKKTKKSSGKPNSGTNTLEELSESDFNQKVLNSDDQWFILFYAPWCGHCKAMMPAFEQSAKEVPSLIRFGRVDCTAN